MPQGKVVLIDYSPALFSPMGDEAQRLAQAGATWEVHECRTEEEVVRVAHDADVIAIQSVRQLLTREIMPKLPRCRCMIRAGAGFDSIDYIAATEYGIMVCNTPTYCTDDVADHAIALMLGAACETSRAWMPPCAVVNTPPNWHAPRAAWQALPWVSLAWGASAQPWPNVYAAGRWRCWPTIPTWRQNVRQSWVCA